MLAPPAFESLTEFVAHLSDTRYWAPYVEAALHRHDIANAGHPPAAGHNATYPTFVCGDVVVKLFGTMSSWRRGYASEHAAYRTLAADPAIAAPCLLASGQLFDSDDAPWPYLITNRLPGAPASLNTLSTGQQLALARALGGQVRRIHALPTAGLTRTGDWPIAHLSAAARRGSLPPHLARQADSFVQTLPPADPVVVHGDLCANHVYVADGAYIGLIDWGDAMVADRHYELIQIHRDLLACDKNLLRTFLDASDWPVTADFAQRALGHALYRQAIGLMQHHSMDVFEPVAAILPLDDMATLDELATALFAV